ncbi:dicarboxylate/amino acid:cation symporter [Ferruginibacter yonginensis]|uniref:Dicarboxylate/amino acid:cation symporter n=1 Tax=Ferruginibacter yonginensis TaxID=1310416 RepID=A0ABV8QXG5_9BACT
MQVKETKRNHLTLYIGIALVLGIVVGFILNTYYVGNENTQLANAEAQQKFLHDQLKKYETPTDTIAYNKLQALKTAAIVQKVAAEKSITQSDNGTANFATVNKWADSIKKIESSIAMLVDTTNPTYKSLVKQQTLLSAQKAIVLKERDKKLDWFTILADIFLRLIKMIVAPLVFTTLVVGVAKLGDISAVGRIGGKTLLWFITASLVSLLLGLILVNIFQPGIAMHLPLPDVGASSGVDKAALSIKEFFYHVFPASAVDAMAKNEILQIVVFALFFGVAAAALGDVAAPVVRALDAIAHIILKVTGYVMKFAPLAVFGAMAAIIAKQGIGILKTYSIFIGEFYFGLALLWVVLIVAGGLFIGKRVLNLVKRIKEPALIAFSTASSEAAFPKTMLELERFGCKNNIVSFVLPLGYSFNLDGSMMYMTFASLFIAQSYGIHLDIATQISMLLVLMLTSKGIAGVPRASLVVIAGTLATFNIPEAGLALLLGIDPLLDMGRSATNVVGNSIATAVVSKMEGALTEAQPPSDI